MSCSVSDLSYCAAFPTIKADLDLKWPVNFFYKTPCNTPWPQGNELAPLDSTSEEKWKMAVECRQFTLDGKTCCVIGVLFLMLSCTLGVPCLWSWELLICITKQQSFESWPILRGFNSIFLCIYVFFLFMIEVPDSYRINIKTYTRDVYRVG